MPWLLLFLAQTSSLHGTVVSADSHEPLGLSIVTLTPTASRRFTDARGGFTFSAVEPGRYVLTVRQIGYVPLDTSIVIREGGETAILVALRHLAIELPPVTITTEQCTKPGRPDSTNRTLAAVFNQLEENAKRFELFADSYPFRYGLERTERTVNERGDTGRGYVHTLKFSSGDSHPYEIGRVVERGWGPWGPNVLVIRSAELQDFSNARFIENHCFRLAGLDTIDGEALVRIDFEPSERIAWSDMAGSAWLDPTSYRLRLTETSLTHPERSELDNVRTLLARTRFREIAPGIPLQDSLHAVTTYRYGKRRRVETQRTIDVRFSRPPPN